jgi:tetratricopeptide (TPR) repeat protein
MENKENTEVVQENPGKSRYGFSSSMPSNSFRDFFEMNKKLVTYGGGGLLVLILGIIGYRYYQQSQNEQAVVDIFPVERYWDADSLNMALKGNGAQRGLEDIASDYSGTKTGNLAHYYVGMAYLRQKKYQQAIDELKDVDNDSKIIMPLTYGGIGDAYSQLKDMDNALKYYEKAAKYDDNTFTAPKFYKKAGLVYEHQKQYKEAAEAYQTIKDKYSSSPEGSEIDKYIARAKTAGGIE